MRVIPPVAITDAKLTSSTVVEVASAAYVGGTTYILGATASVAGALGLLTEYKSLQAGNVGHAPASSPTWWQRIGDTYQVYSAAATYGLLDNVIDPVNHLVYSSVVAGNIGQALTDPTKWLETGRTNRYAMFDYTTSQATTSPVPITVVLVPGERCNSLSVAGMAGNTVSMSVSSGGTVVYTASENLDTRAVFDAYAYCFEPFSTKPTLIKFDLPPYTNAIITLTLSATAGDVQLTYYGVGTYVYIGNTQYNAKPGGTNYSSVTRKFDGTLNKLVPRRSVPKASQTIALTKDRVNIVRKLIDRLNAVPAFWSGLDDDTDGYFDSLFFVGFYTSFEFDLDAPKDALLRLDLEEI